MINNLFALTVISDSYMGMFLPSDIYKRISKFLDGTLSFPFINKDEILGIFFLFGKNFGVKTQFRYSFCQRSCKKIN